MFMKTTTQPFAIIEKDDIITRYDGELYTFHTIAELQDFYKNQVSTLVFLTPFCTIRERGFESHGNEPILAIQANKTTILIREVLEKTLSDKEIIFEQPITPSQSDEEFATLVKQIQDREIAGGNICQMILSQPYIGKIQDFSEQDVESVFWNCLKQKWQYMTVFMSDGNWQYFVSLTPEQHLKIDANEVTMNPIAGTLRKGDRDTLRDRLIDFLGTKKEQNELFQVLDEELKMMESICTDGWRIEWPFLRQNGAVIHTEYTLIGKKNPEIGPLDALRETLHAPTLVGWPIESAARLIKKYETRSRGYYGGEIGILTPDNHLDTAILIRMAHFRPDGTLTIQAGAGITKNSSPIDEAYEVRAKTGGMQSALLWKTQIPPNVQDILEDVEVITTLQSRNKNLSKFHFLDQSNLAENDILKNKTATIIDNEDNFSQMLARMMTRMGMKAQVVSTTDFDPSTNTSDIVLIWPGPGDINNMNDIKMTTLMWHTRALMKSKRNILWVCLGHQAIARAMGIPVERMSIPTQGEQIELDISWTPEKLWFYNSFCPVDEGFDDFTYFRQYLPIIRSGNISGFQFHPESVMSQHGYEILEDELVRIISND